MKKYTAPQLTVVEFKVERGYASSLDEFSYDNLKFDMMNLGLDQNGDGTPDQNLENYTIIDGTNGNPNWGDASTNHFF
ncbi:MAG: hypothetical protein IKP21_05415 [Bacteroidales bacterium]|nr:hypothetical protein [Bacteroidales bacterium]